MTRCPFSLSRLTTLIDHIRPVRLIPVARIEFPIANWGQAEVQQERLDLCNSLCEHRRFEWSMVYEQRGF
jgi:hypothetical protein